MHAPNLRSRFKEMQADAYMCTLTYAHPHAQTCCCPRRSCTHAHTYTHTHTRATECPLCQCPEEIPLLGHNSKPKTPLWQYADQTAHASSHRKLVLPLRKKVFCAQVLDVLHSSHFGQSNPFWKKAHLVLSSQHESESIHTFY